MGKVTDLTTRLAARSGTAQPGRRVSCAQCGERHPIVRLGDGSLRCVTAFADGERWFCRNRGCRAAWLASHNGSEK